MIAVDRMVAFNAESTPLEATPWDGGGTVLDLHMAFQAVIVVVGQRWSPRSV